MKKKMFDGLRVLLAKEIMHSLKALWPNEECSLESIYAQLVLPPQKNMGHLAWGTFPLAKSLKMAPPQIAQKVAEFLQNQTSPLFQQALTVANLTKGQTADQNLESVKSISSAGPYVNFFFSGPVLSETIMNPILKGESFSAPLFEGAPRTMVEFSQPNTHKELHVGHMRNACLGDAIIKLYRYAGIPVISTTFPGDVGTHVAKCLWYLKNKNQEPIPTAHKGEWLGRLYTKAHLYIEDHEGQDEETSIKESMAMILRQLEAQSGEYFDLWKLTRQWSIETMKDIYSWCNIEFDHWYWESDVDSASVQTIKKYYAEGRLVESQGAIGLDLNDQNLGFCVLLKSDGNGLYSTKDVELARRKFQDHHVERSIYVVDTRQALHFKQVFATLKHLGFPFADQCFHLQYNFVELPDGAMSSRKGNIVPLTSLIDQMESHVKENYLKRYEQEWTQDEINQTARTVAQGAIKYGMVRMDPNKKIVFDMTEWLKLDGESGPYIQYAYARIQSLIRKFEAWTLTHDQKSSQPLGQSLQQETELQLLILLGQLNSHVALAIESYRPNVICNYLFEVAKQFSQFYHDCPIGNAESDELRRDRLRLAEATGLVLKQGLALLGIPVPSRM